MGKKQNKHKAKAPGLNPAHDDEEPRVVELPDDYDENADKQTKVEEKKESPAASGKQKEGKKGKSSAEKSEPKVVELAKEEEIKVEPKQTETKKKEKEQAKPAEKKKEDQPVDPKQPEAKKTEEKVEDGSKVTAEVKEEAATKKGKQIFHRLVMCCMLSMGRETLHTKFASHRPDGKNVRQSPLTVGHANFNENIVLKNVAISSSNFSPSFYR